MSWRFDLSQCIIIQSFRFGFLFGIAFHSLSIIFLEKIRLNHKQHLFKFCLFHSIINNIAFSSKPKVYLYRFITPASAVPCFDRVVCGPGKNHCTFVVERNAIYDSCKDMSICIIIIVNNCILWHIVYSITRFKPK